MKLSFKLAIAIFLLILASTLNFTVTYFLQLFRFFGQSIDQSSVLGIVQYIQIGLYVIIGLWIVSMISDAIIISTKSRLGMRAIVIANSVKYLGYIIVILVVLLPLGVNSSTLIAGSAFAGLIIGLALQPVLSNFFAGLLIILTGYISVGDRIRLVSTQVPFVAAQFPVYKYFSVDFVEHGYKGSIVEIDLFYSRILLENMRELRVPNTVLLNSAVIDYTSKYSSYQIINVRAEFPLNVVDIDVLEDLVRERLRGFDVAEGPYINEQSDKEHVIVLVRLRVDINEDWRRVKSEALKRLLRLRQELITRKQQESQQQVKEVK
ncbi:MAG: mechanosensitive ion channel family protein [Sulfolobaceae archaeon]